ncbi:ORF6N domain-containing protein [Algoriphagus halophytocola]|uniref:ORF6N domain-containing protein n=1 Tax=Algoriphagus halophytocola TaxID=2991499 RepID=A0ABY6MCJ9_9BACT|nr:MULTISPECIES: ORF6N domain-containing protein [unclassified Algoriphagus]UZD21019.1 ORF6N domain-containing protein [Algoriphagus sp. TR-M5]WBL42185.1 ORF6N domain-containing protein [Algoriphagus sp. TR-M9]
MNELLNEEQVLQLIHKIRNQKVMLDSDLAEMYGVPTKRLNEQVKRNSDRFPEDFMFQLGEEEWKKLEVAFCDLKMGRQENSSLCIYRTGCGNVIFSIE